MNSDGAGPAQSPRWKRELVPVQFLSHLKNLQLIRVAEEAAVCGACGGKLGIFSSDWFKKNRTEPVPPLGWPVLV